MPELGSLRIGAYRARLLNDSAALRLGANTLTVHVADLPVRADVALRLHGPGGEVIDVPLRPLRVLGAPDDARHGAVTGPAGGPAHGSAADAAHPPAPVLEGDAGSHDHAKRPEPRATHAVEATTHAGEAHAEAPDGHGTEVHGGDGLAGFAARGAARLPAAGAWRAVLTAADGRGEPLIGELALHVATDGPNLLYLGFLGFVSGGSVLYGWIRRRHAGSE